MFHAVRLKVLALGRETVNQGQCLWGSENSCRTEVAVGAGVTGWVAMILGWSGGVFGFLAATRSIRRGISPLRKPTASRERSRKENASDCFGRKDWPGRGCEVWRADLKIRRREAAFSTGRRSLNRTLETHLQPRCSTLRNRNLQTHLKP
jgi:hypothetical protein